MKIWITKWALTRGILVAEAESQNGWLSARVQRDGYSHLMLHGSDFHPTELGARMKAEQMAEAKVHAAEKVIAKLRGKTGDRFKVSEFK